jgi:hypothetical protein
MNPQLSNAAATAASNFVLRFESLFHPGRALAFPCDSAGRVVMDHLAPRALQNSLYARAVVGREFATPCVVPHLAS